MDTTGLILDLRPANERRRHKVTPSLIGERKPKISPVISISQSSRQDTSATATLEHVTLAAIKDTAIQVPYHFIQVTATHLKIGYR